MTATRSSIFELENVALGYNGRTVLSVDGLRFERGTLYALLGPNGSGKTTLLRALNGFVRPQRGRILFDGSPLADEGDLTAARRRMVYIAQSPVLFNTTVYANVAYGLRVRGVSGAETARRVRAVLDKVGIAHFARRNVRSLSGGEAQLTALARALVLEPEALLLDEPTGNVDVANTDVIEQLIRDSVKRLNAAIIFSSHNIDQAQRIADVSIKIVDGSVVAGRQDRE